MWVLLYICSRKTKLDLVAKLLKLKKKKKLECPYMTRTQEYKNSEENGKCISFTKYSHPVKL